VSPIDLSIVFPSRSIMLALMWQMKDATQAPSEDVAGLLWTAGWVRSMLVLWS
jgi:hypothetical protein